LGQARRPRLENPRSQVEVLPQRIEEVETTDLRASQVERFRVKGYVIGFQIVHNGRVEKGLLLMVFRQDVRIDVASALTPAAVPQPRPVGTLIEDLAASFLLLERVQSLEPLYIILARVLG